MTKRRFLQRAAGFVVGFLAAMLAVLALYLATAAIGMFQQLPSVITLLVGMPVFIWAQRAYISRSKRLQNNRVASRPEYS
ncbi:hypothetical protein IEU95_09875 [Hoyosella rhizosphaerae]|uniref:hypothetical protein n=1 Tax=Hoyosella rhizosphaerae TaxID=1755582 RepID=UPI001664CF9E|nr:hypothetical protein [Hoyosella rhizosphaerae]MBN4927141.1 hypothetical protein [Hoyosella rhizosphaerae]